MRKRIKIVFAIVILMMFYMENIFQNYSYANEKFDNNRIGELSDCVVENERTEFEKAYNNDDFVKRKVDEEVKNVTGIVDEKIEEKLNEGGFFDEEIEKIDKVTLAELEEAEVEHIDVLTEYYMYDIDISSELVEMNNEEIDKMFEEEYYEENNEGTENEVNEKKSVLERFGRVIGIVPEEVYAATSYKYKDEKKIDGAVLKKTMMVVPLSDNKYKLYFECEWEKVDELFPREVDLIKLTWDSQKMTYDDTSICRSGLQAKVETTYTTTTRKQITGNLISCKSETKTEKINFLPYAKTFEKSVDIHKNEGAINSTAMIIAVGLMNNSTIPDELNNNVTKTEVESIIIRAQTYVIKRDIYGGQPPTDENFSYSLIYSHLSRKLTWEFKYVSINLKGTKEEIACDVTKLILANAANVKYKDYYKESSLRGAYFYQYNYK